ncbi:Hypothetical_protein [Hexamita inflata]|uniref:Hypothetical_protein n=1 Tax=Hexamita inflata TaxID=28002 RepID=A0AA86TW33_9EUKA|nr:Hypothetical protein HINF_LOCUS18659 [Hexamita inflata]
MNHWAQAQLPTIKNKSCKTSAIKIKDIESEYLGYKFFVNAVGSCSYFMNNIITIIQLKPYQQYQCSIQPSINNTQLPYSTKGCYQQKDLQNKLHQPEKVNGDSVRRFDV